MEMQNEKQGLIIGRNAVAEALKSGRAIDSVMVAKGEITTGTLLSYVVYLEMLKEPTDFISRLSNWWSRCSDSAQRVFEICDAEPDITEKENAVSFDNLRGDIEINELEFEYEPASC